MGNCKLYTLNKRHNSTMQPTGTGTDTSVILKGGSDFLTPVFTMHHNTFPTYNYVKYNSRYYFVTGIKAIHDDLFEMSCEVDVLATFKASIQAISAYVLYYDHVNTEIVDKRLSVKTTQVTKSTSGNFSYFGKGTIYVLSVIGKNCVNQIKVTLSDIQGIVNQTFLDTLNNQIANISLPAADSLIDFANYIKDLLTTEAGALTYLGRVADCIRNCYVLPITSGAWGGTLVDIYIGKTDSGKDGYALTDRILHDSATVYIPWPDNITDWRRNAPYTELYLYIPAIGICSISPSDVMGETALHVDISLDKVSGDVIFEVGTASKVIAYYTANVAVNFPIGMSNLDVTKAVTAVGGGIAAIGAGVNPAITAAVEALGITNALQPSPTCIGGNSGGALLGLVEYTAQHVYMFSVFHDTSVAPTNPSAIKGTPFNAVTPLSAISGYVQTTGASVAGGGVGEPAMTDTERQNINSLLDGGIYIE